MGSGPPLGWLILEEATVPERWKDRSRSVVLVPLLPEETAEVLDRGFTAPQFTAAEERLMGHLSEGCSLKVIASRLGVTSRTVERRLARVRERFGLDTTAELKALLARMGR